MDNSRISPPFQVRTSGLITNNPYHSVPGTRLNDTMLTLFTHGSGTYRNSKGTWKLQPNLAMILSPDDPGALIADSRDPYTHYFCRFNGSYAVKLANDIVEKRGGICFEVGNADAVADCMRRMGRHNTPDLPVRMGKRDVLLAETLLLLQGSREAEDVHSTFTKPALMEYLVENIEQPTQLDLIADHFNMSRSSLCRKTRTLCGKTIQQLHEEMKMNWAHSLLGTGLLNISQVAHRVGYLDPFYFSRVFKKHSGSSPRNWLATRKASNGSTSREQPLN
ncbi:MAG: AraC family transcriptional regulator [Verrucomicrobiota bacterium]